MKVFNTIMKVLAAAAAVLGVVYVAATYGDKIVAWAKKLLKCPACEETEEAPVVEETVEVEAAAEEEAPVVEEEAPVAEETVEEAPAVEEEAPVADEADFEG